MKKSNTSWDVVENKDFEDCLLGYFRNHPVDNPSRLGEKFSILTAVKDLSVCPDGRRYEENYGQRWMHFRPATEEEVKTRIYKNG